jgi:hypothetical protein
MLEIKANEETPYRIKDWAEARDEFGLSSGGSLKTRGRYFRATEAHLCGKVVYVRYASSSRKTYEVYVSGRSRNYLYTISVDMLEPLYIEADDDINEVNALDFAKILEVS